MSNTNTAASGFIASTLCCKYLLAVLVDVSEIWVERRRVREHLLRWGVGVLPDGEYELLGVWHQADAAPLVWARIFEELKVRGVARIRFVVGSEPVAIESALPESYPGVTVLPAIGQFPGDVEADVLGSLTLRQRLTVCHSIEAANQLNQRLSRAVARRGCFPSAAAAASFAVDWLARAERDFDAVGATAMAGQLHLGPRSIGRSGVVAAGS